MHVACRDLHKLRRQPQISAWHKVRARLVSRVHECNVWVRCCGRPVNLVGIMKAYAESVVEDYSDDDGGCSECDCDCGSGYGRRPMEPSTPSEEWLAACPALAWANMRVAAIDRPSITMLLGPE